jgi:hypothetical protein
VDFQRKWQDISSSIHLKQLDYRKNSLELSKIVNDTVTKFKTNVHGRDMLVDK